MRSDVHAFPFHEFIDGQWCQHEVLVFNGHHWLAIRTPWKERCAVRRWARRLLERIRLGHSLRLNIMGPENKNPLAFFWGSPMLQHIMMAGEEKRKREPRSWQPLAGFQLTISSQMLSFPPSIITFISHRV